MNNSPNLDWFFIGNDAISGCIKEVRKNLKDCLAGVWSSAGARVAAFFEKGF